MLLNIINSYEAAIIKKKIEINKIDNNLKSFTSDIWSTGNQSYMCVTLHYIDGSYQLHNDLIGFEHFGENHSGVNINQKLQDVFKK